MCSLCGVTYICCLQLTCFSTLYAITVAVEVNVFVRGEGAERSVVSSDPFIRLNTELIICVKIRQSVNTECGIGGGGGAVHVVGCAGENQMYTDNVSTWRARGRNTTHLVERSHKKQE